MIGREAEMAKRRRTYGTGSVYLPPGCKTWWVQYWRWGKRYRESSHSEKRANAKNLLKKRLGDIATGRFIGLAPEKITISGLCDLVIDDYRRYQKRSVQHVIWRSDSHIRPALGTLRAADFGSTNVQRYIDLRQKQRATSATINRELAIIRRGFHLADQADPPLVARVPFIPILNEENVREGFIEYDQYRALRDELPQRLKCLFVVGYHVGNRKSELLKLERTQVDLKAKEIRLTGPQTKGKKPRTLPIYGEMGPWLEMQLTDLEQNWPNCRWVFHHRGQRVGAHLIGWKEACERAGLAGLLFHDLRRSAIRNLERAGVPRKIAMQITGHRTEAVYRRYDIVAPQDLRLAAVKMDAYMADAGAQSKKATKTAIAGGKAN